MAISSATRILAARPLVLGLAKLCFLAVANLPVISAAPTFIINSDVDPKPPSDPSLWLYLGVAAALVLSGGAFAGLTIALMGQVTPISHSELFSCSCAMALMTSLLPQTG